MLDMDDATKRSRSVLKRARRERRRKNLWKLEGCREERKKAATHLVCSRLLSVRMRSMNDPFSSHHVKLDSAQMHLVQESSLVSSVSNEALVGEGRAVPNKGRVEGRR